MLRIEVINETTSQLGEGPLWCERENRLYWTDSFGPGVYRSDAAGGDIKHWPLPEPVGSMALRESGGAVLALSSGFHFLDFESGEVTQSHQAQIHPPKRD